MRKFQIKNVLFNFFVIITIILTCFVSFLLISGTKAFSVQTDSMYPIMERGSVVFIRPIIFDNIVANDIVAVNFPDDSGVFTHRVIRIDDDSRVIYTKGDHNMSEDPEPSSESQIIGKMWFSIPYIGYISLYQESYAVLYFLIILAILLFITRLIAQSAKKTNS